jgi:5-methylthioadenosine/S-adenosylhomocysteine deaminase
VPESTLIEHSYVITVDPRLAIFEDGAVLIEGDRIVAVGPSEAVKPPRQPDVRIDGRHHALLPGFINLHMHSGLIRGTAEGLPLFEWLRQYVDPKHRVLTAEDAYVAALLCYSEMVRGGATCALDMYRFMNRCADAAEKVGVRAVLAPYVADRPEYDYFEKLQDNVKLVEERHGSAGGRVQVWFGLEHLTYCTEEAYQRVAEYAQRYGVGIHTHGEESLDMFLRLKREHGKDPVELFHERGILGPRTVLAHCVWLTPKEIALLQHTGTSVAHCPVSNMKLGSGIAPIPELQAHGVTVGLGSDGIKENNRIDLFQEMKIASLLQRVHRLDATLLPPEDVLRMATINGARALGLEHELGSLEPGKKADLVLVDLRGLHLAPVLHGEFANVVANIVYAAHTADVDSVMVNGRWVVKDGQLVTLKVDEVIEAHAHATGALLERRKPYARGS